MIGIGVFIILLAICILIMDFMIISNINRISELEKWQELLYRRAIELEQRIEENSEEDF